MFGPSVYGVRKMKWAIVAILIVNNQPTQVVQPERYDTIGDCNYHAMRLVFQMHTAAQWSIRCVEVVE